MAYDGSITIRTRTKVRFRSERKREQFERVFKNDASMLKVTEATAEMIRPYVPYLTGTLNESVEITPRTISWNTPYAHYMYEGVVYGPNFYLPTTRNPDGSWNKDGPWGWKSPSEKSKTDRLIQYNRDPSDYTNYIGPKLVDDERRAIIHPLATRHWDRAMLKAEGRKYRTRIGRIILREFRRLNGRHSG